MKILFYFILSLQTNFILGQNLKGVAIDSDSKKPIDLATVYFKESRYTIFTNSEGNFSVAIDAKNKKQALVISSIGYEDLEIDLKKYTENIEYIHIFELIPKVQMLDEITISNEKIEYSWAKSITSERTPRAGFSFQFGTENVAFVQNPYFKKGKVKKVILSLNKLKQDKKQPNWEIDYFTSYNVKFYRYDAKNQKPGKELYNRNIIVEPENKTYDFVIDVDSLHIPFPKEGVCVGVEFVNTKYENPKSNFALIGPTMNFYEEEKLKPIISWSRYRGEDWEFRSSISNFKNRRYQNVMVVDLVVNTEK